MIDNLTKRGWMLPNMCYLYRAHQEQQIICPTDAITQRGPETW
jgi:hypothetical protein